MGRIKLGAVSVSGRVSARLGEWIESVKDVALTSTPDNAPRISKKDLLEMVGKPFPSAAQVSQAFAQLVDDNKLVRSKLGQYRVLVPSDPQPKVDEAPSSSPRDLSRSGSAGNDERPSVASDNVLYLRDGPGSNSATGCGSDFYSQLINLIKRSSPASTPSKLRICLNGTGIGSDLGRLEDLGHALADALSKGRTAKILLHSPSDVLGIYARTKSRNLARSLYPGQDLREAYQSNFEAAMSSALDSLQYLVRLDARTQGLLEVKLFRSPITDPCAILEEGDQLISLRAYYRPDIGCGEIPPYITDNHLISESERKGFDYLWEQSDDVGSMIRGIDKAPYPLRDPLIEMVLRWAILPASASSSELAEKKDAIICRAIARNIAKQLDEDISQDKLFAAGKSQELFGAQARTRGFTLNPELRSGF